MAKKIKSFTVDEDAYNRLVSIFKQSGAETSISMYLNNQVKWLVEHLEDLQKGIDEMKYSVPMSYVIDRIVNDSEKSGRMSREPYDEKASVSELEMALNDWEDDYDADQKGIPYEYYRWLQNSNYMLSNDKRFLIDKETGKKYISTSRSTLMEVREIDSEA
jgi:hypothetical protein